MIRPPRGRSTANAVPASLLEATGPIRLREADPFPATCLTLITPALRGPLRQAGPIRGARVARDASGSRPPVLSQPIEERSAAQPQAPGGLRLVAADRGHRTADQIALDGLDVLAEVDGPVCRLRAVRGGGSRFVAGEPRLVEREVLAVGDNRPTFDDVLQLANVSRPGIRPEHLQRLLIHAPDSTAQLARANAKEMVHQQ